MRARGFLILFLICSISVAVHAEIPYQINYQGTLTDNMGEPETGNFDFTFRIYDSPFGGSLLWEETHNDVSVNAGIFNVLLGAANPIDPGDVNFNGTFWLQIIVDGETMSPRLKLTSTGQSYRSAQADDVFDRNITPQSISITGYGTVINSSGEWVGEAMGLAGPTGPSGPSGPSGPMGLTGATGPAGPSGPTGPAGATGSRGPSGPTGSPGAQGPTGARGPSGPSGPIGPAGSRGPSGPTGSRGPSGPQGPTGAMGPTGARGPTGSRGPSGPGNGWTDSGSTVSLVTNSDTVGIGSSSTGLYKLYVDGAKRGIYSEVSVADNDRPWAYMAGMNASGSALTGGAYRTDITTSSSGCGFVYGLYAGINDDGGSAVRGITIHISNQDSDDTALELLVDSPGYNISANGSGSNYLAGKTGLGSASAPSYQLQVESDTTHVIHSEYTYDSYTDGIAVYGRSWPYDNWGYGGYFEGGYRGVYGYSYSTGGYFYGGNTGVYAYGDYYGVYTYADTYGIRSSALNPITAVITSTSDSPRPWGVCIRASAYGSSAYTNGGGAHCGYHTDDLPAYFNYGFYAGIDDDNGRLLRGFTATGSGWGGDDIAFESAFKNAGCHFGGNTGIGVYPSENYKLHVAGPACVNGLWIASDSRLQKNVRPIDNALELVQKINGVSYEWLSENEDKGLPQGTHYGLSAQELAELFPDSSIIRITDGNESIKLDPDVAEYYDENPMKCDGDMAVSYSQLVPVLVEAVKDLSQQVETLKNQVEELQGF